MLLQDGQWNWNHIVVHSQALDLACNHKAREQMFHIILNASHACFTLCQKKIRDQDWIQLPETLIDKMCIPPSQYQWIRNLSVILFNHGYWCKNCQIDPSIFIVVQIDPQSGFFHGALRGGHLGLRFWHSHMNFGPELKVHCLSLCFLLNLVLKHLVVISSFSLVLLITQHRVNTFT